METRKFYALEKVGDVATLNIFDDIGGWGYTSKNLINELNEMEDVKQINVHLNSYGGEVAEGLAIYNTLKNHKAKIKTYCDGFACSIASIIFLSGDERVMNESSLLMIHNAWMIVQGNAEELRKQADDLDKITEASIKIYKAVSNLEDDEIKKLLDEETWISSEEALEMGFATSILKTSESKNPTQSIRSKVFELIKQTSTEEEISIDDDTLENEDDTEIEVDDGTEDSNIVEDEDEDEDEDVAQQKTLFERLIKII